MAHPLFSICIPTYNRAHSLKQSLKSAVEQNFDDYEIIVSDNCSQDDTRNTAASFTSAKIRYHRNEKNIGMVGNWNSALSKAKGEYAALLFDDDEFAPNHLKEAARILASHKNIGIYAVGNQSSKLPRTGFIAAKDYFRYIYSIAYVSTPSETIFKRTHRGKSYFFNTAYHYCPEVELYLEISNNGYKAYHSDLQTIIRHSTEKSNSRQVAFTWIPFNDKFAILKKWKDNALLEPQDFPNALKLNTRFALEKYAAGKLQRIEGAQEIFHGVKKEIKPLLPLSYYHFCIMKMASDIAEKFHLLNIRQARKLYHFMGR